MAGLQFETLTGQLAIDGVAMRCPAWTIVRLSPFWMPGQRRGQDRRIPNAPGVRANPRRWDVTEVPLQIVITGKADRLGVAPEPCTDAALIEQLEANVDYLRANVVDPYGVGDGTRQAVLTMPSGAVRNGRIHVEDMQIQTEIGIHSLVCSFDVTVKRGVLAT